MNTDIEKHLKIQFGRIAQIQIHPNMWAASLILDVKGEKDQMKAYFQSSAFAYPRAGATLAFFSNEEMTRPPKQGDIIVFVVEPEAERQRRIAAMGTKAGRAEAADVDIHFEKHQDRKKIVHACMKGQWESVLSEIKSRPRFQILQAADSAEPLFEGSLMALEENGDEALWNTSLVIKEWYRGGWVICEEDPRLAWKRESTALPMAATPPEPVVKAPAEGAKPAGKPPRRRQDRSESTQPPGGAEAAAPTAS